MGKVLCTCRPVLALANVNLVQLPHSSENIYASNKQAIAKIDLEFEDENVFQMN